MSDSDFDFLDDAFSSSTSNEEGVLELKLSEVQPDPDQPRDEFDQEKLELLAESIKQQGIIQPIGVKPKNDDGIYFLVFGERRLTAAKMAGLETVRCIVDPTTKESNSGDKELEVNNFVRQVHENKFSEDLSALEYANACQKLKSLGKNNAEIANLLVLDKADVSRFLSLINMPEHIKSLYESGIVSSHRVLNQLVTANEYNENETKIFCEFIEKEGGCTFRKAETFKKMQKASLDKGNDPHSPTLDSDATIDEEISGDTELNPGGDTELNPGGDTELNPGGDTELNPDGDTELNPDGDTELNSGGDTELNPDGDTELNSDGDTELNPGSDTETYRKKVKLSVSAEGIDATIDVFLNVKDNSVILNLADGNQQSVDLSKLSVNGLVL